MSADFKPEYMRLSVLTAALQELTPREKRRKERRDDKEDRREKRRDRRRRRN